MRKGRRRLCLATAAVCSVLAAGAAQAQAPVPSDPLPDQTTEAPDPGGNSADQSAGTVQVGAVTVDPAPVVASAPEEAGATGATGTTGAVIGEPGGNSASGSGGTVQVGGNNSATGSAGGA